VNTNFWIIVPDMTPFLKTEITSDSRIDHDSTVYQCPCFDSKARISKESLAGRL